MILKIAMALLLTFLLVGIWVSVDQDRDTPVEQFVARGALALAHDVME